MVRKKRLGWGTNQILPALPEVAEPGQPKSLDPSKLGSLLKSEKSSGINGEGVSNQHRILPQDRTLSQTSSVTSSVEKQTTLKQRRAKLGRQRNSSIRRAVISSNKVTFVILMCYCVCYMPYLVLSSLHILCPHLGVTEGHVTSSVVLFALNPVAYFTVYYTQNAPFRTAFKSLFCSR